VPIQTDDQAQRPRWTLVDAAWTSRAAEDASRDNETAG
jgi:hypothetical protein